MNKTKSKSVCTQEMKLFRKNVPLLYINSPENFKMWILDSTGKQQENEIPIIHLVH